MCKHATIGYGFTFDWMKKRHVIHKPIVMQNQLLFDTQMKLGMVQTTPHGCAEDFVNHGNTALSRGMAGYSAKQ